MVSYPSSLVLWCSVCHDGAITEKRPNTPPIISGESRFLDFLWLNLHLPNHFALACQGRTSLGIGFQSANRFTRRRKYDGVVRQLRDGTGVTVAGVAERRVRLPIVLARICDTKYTLFWRKRSSQKQRYQAQV